MGYHLAEHLDHEGHEVFVVDTDPDRVEFVRTRLDVMGVAGSACSVEVLRKLGASRADIMIAVTNSDEVSFVACLLARHLGVKRRIARVQSAQLARDVHQIAPEVLGVDQVMSPVEVTAKRLVSMVMTPGSTESAEFSEGQMVLRALWVSGDSPLALGPVREAHGRFSERFLIAAVKRGTSLFVPTGEFKAAEGDLIYAILRPEDLDRFLEVFRLRRQPTNRVMVFGASPIGQMLCHFLEGVVDDLLLLDPRREVCDQAGKLLRRTSIIHGSALDKVLMQDLKISSVDCFLGLTEKDEENLSSALLADRLGARNVIMLTAEPEYVDLLSTLPLAAVVSPILLSVGAVLASIRERSVLSLFNLAGNRADAVGLSGAQAAVASEVDEPAAVRKGHCRGTDGADHRQPDFPLRYGFRHRDAAGPAVPGRLCAGEPGRHGGRRDRHGGLIGRCHAQQHRSGPFRRGRHAELRLAAAAGQIHPLRVYAHGAPGGLRRHHHVHAVRMAQVNGIRRKRGLNGDTGVALPSSPGAE
jgi:trk system potassium uptake protein TrkA